MSKDCSAGLSWAWLKIMRREPPFEGCCDNHDDAYRGTNRIGTRKYHDLEMRKCIVDRGYTGLAAVMYIAVRLFGWMFWSR